MREYIDIDILKPKQIDIEIDRSGGSEMVNYNTQVFNKPSINDVILIGNKKSKEIGVQDYMDAITEQDIDEIMFGG